MNLKCLLHHNYRLLESYPLSLVDIHMCRECGKRKVSYGKLPTGAKVSYQAVDKHS